MVSRWWTLGRSASPASRRRTSTALGRSASPASRRRTSTALGRSASPASRRRTSTALGRSASPASRRRTSTALGRSASPASRRRTSTALGRSTYGQKRKRRHQHAFPSTGNSDDSRSPIQGISEVSKSDVSMSDVSTRSNMADDNRATVNKRANNETNVKLIAMIYGIGVEEDKKTKVETGFIIPIICTLSFNPEQEFKALGHISKSMRDDAETAYIAARHELDQVERTIKYLVTLEYRHRASLNGPSGQLATALEELEIGGLLCKVRKCLDLYKFVIVPDAQEQDIPEKLKKRIKVLPVAELSGAIQLIWSIKKKTIKENPIP